MKKNVLIIILVLLIIIMAIFMILNLDRKDDGNKIDNGIYNAVVSTDANEINAIKNEINATGQTDIYQVEQEYDGRKIIQIKPDIQYEVALAGIIKNDIPAEDEIYTLLEQAPKNRGIWISETSREKFMQLLNNNSISGFEITSDGYLQCDKENNLKEQEEKLKNMSEADKLYVIDMSGKTYQREYLTGEIIEYPFEEMEPYQIIEPYYESENAIILGITSNKDNQVDDNDILNAILAYK